MSLENTAKDFLSEPLFNKVFKNTVDVIKEKVYQILVVIGALAIAIRIGANLQSGDLVCIVVGSEGNLTWIQLAGPFHLAMANYAAQDRDCYSEVYSEDLFGLFRYSSFIVMIQAIFLIFLERLTIMLPILNKRLERFYKSVVEETLIGKDPDVAEDFSGAELSIEKILRLRQREEICGALQSSSTFYWCYFFRNLAQGLAGCCFVLLNSFFIHHSSDSIGFCTIHLGNTEQMVQMQCRQKRYDITKSLMLVFSACLVLTILLNMISIIWWCEGLGLRTITKIFRSLRDKKKKDLIKTDGKDFLFMFDLLAHNCGVPATLRVLTYTAPKFTEFCQPEIDNSRLRMDESSLSICWNPPQLQKIDEELAKTLNLQKYVVTILPKLKENYLTVPKGGNYTAEFKDLEGGTREYIVTVSAIISNAKMKGMAFRTYLPPHPPQNLKVEQDTTEETLKVSWMKPKGDFEKYLLLINNISSRHTDPLNCNINKESCNIEMETWLPKDLNEFVISHLEPGEAYEIQLQTVSGSQPCQKILVPKTKCLTKSKPPALDDIKIIVSSNQVDVYWQSPNQGKGHTLLDGYEIQLKNAACNEIAKDFLGNSTFRYTFTNLGHGQEYSMCLASVCRQRDGQQRIVLSSKSQQICKKFMSLPGAPANLTLDKSEPNSIKVHWDSPNLNTEDISFAVTVELIGDYEEKYFSERKVDSNSFKISPLPHSGAVYEIHVRSMLIYNSDPLYSKTVAGLFVTKPYPPSDLEIIDSELQEFKWIKSVTSSVNQYKFKIKGNNISHEFIVPNQEGEEVRFKLHMELEEGVEYNINLVSQAWINDTWHDSNSFFIKLLKENSHPDFSTAVDSDELDGKQPVKQLNLIRNLEKDAKNVEKNSTALMKQLQRMKSINNSNLKLNLI